MFKKNHLKTLTICVFFCIATLTNAQESVSFEKLRDIVALAESGNSEAQRSLGIIYMTGIDDVEADVEKAEKWLTAAGAQGAQDAYVLLARIYSEGTLVPKNDTKVSTYMRLAMMGLKDDGEQLKLFDDDVLKDAVVAGVTGAMKAESEKKEASAKEAALAKEAKTREQAEAREKAQARARAAQIESEKRQQLLVQGNRQRTNSQEVMQMCMWGNGGALWKISYEIHGMGHSRENFCNCVGYRTGLKGWGLLTNNSFSYDPLHANTVRPCIENAVSGGE